MIPHLRVDHYSKTLKIRSLIAFYTADDASEGFIRVIARLLITRNREI